VDNGKHVVQLERFLPFIDINNCRKNMSTSIQQFMFHDKFCTIFTLGNTNLDSDSGVESIDFTVIGSCCFCLWLNDNFTLYAYNVDIQ